MSTNAIYDALMALGAGISASSTGPIAESGRRLKLWDKAQKPSLFQVEPDDHVTSKLGLLNKRTLDATWVFYHAIGKDQSTTPAEATTDLIDATLAAFVMPGGYYQTLGGLVTAAFVNGRIRKFEGDLDGQTIITVPIQILVP